MDTTKLRYTIKAIFTPSVWFRNEKRHPEFDRWLWEALTIYSLTILNEYTAEIAGVEIWIANAPYANGHPYPKNEDMHCGRATALLLRDLVDYEKLNMKKAVWRDWEKAHGLAKVNR